AGLIRLVRNTGDVAGIHASLVYAGDQFEYFEEDGCVHYKHVRNIGPDFDDDPQRIRAAYAVVNYRDGTWEIEPMSRRQIESVRAVSRARKKGTPWDVWYDEMAKKTVLRRLCKRLDQSPVALVTAAMDRDETMPTIDGEAEPSQGRNLVPTPPPRRPAPAPSQQAAPAGGNDGGGENNNPTDRDPSDPGPGTDGQDGGAGSATTKPPADDAGTPDGGAKPPHIEALFYPADKNGEPIMNGD